MSRELPDQSLGPEWTVLELLCRGITTDGERDLLRELLQSDGLLWGELLEQALRHQMLPMLAFHVASEELRFSIPKYVYDLLVAELEVNRRRLDVFRRETAKVSTALNDAGLRFVATKGITFESTVYGGNGTRRMNDVDLMILPDDRDAVTAVMNSIGYETSFEWTAHPRREQIAYRLNPDHLPKFAKQTDEPFVGSFFVDIANSLTWTNSPYELPVEAALDATADQEIPGITGVRLPCFNPVFQLAFTILHLFREAWLERWLEYEIDVNLMKFGDVIRLFDHHRDRLVGLEFVRTITTFNIVEPVVWVLEHLDRSFRANIVETLGLVGRVEESWLASAHPSRGMHRTWTGTMRQRLQSKNRKSMFVEDPAPVTPTGAPSE